MARNNSQMFPDPQDDDVASPEAPAIDTGDDLVPNDEIFDELKTKCRESFDHREQWWNEARACYDMYAGRQWTDEDKQILENQLRPVITFNRIGPVVDSLVGMEMNDRKQVQYYPVTQGDVAINELYSSAAMWVREQADAEDEESDAFMDLAICGEGWTDTHLVQDESEDGKLDIRIDRVDPLEMASDPNSKKRNYADARYVVRKRDIPLSEAKAMFPGFEDEDYHAAWASDKESQELVDRPQKYLFNDSKGSGEGRSCQRVTMVEIQWWEKRDYWKVLDPTTGQITHFDDATYQTATKRWKDLSKQMFQITGQQLPPIQAARYKRKVFRRVFLGSIILKMAPLPYPYGFSYNAMTGKRDRNKRYWFGLVRSMKDPQEWANKWLSQILHIINSNAKGGLVAAKSSFEDWRAVEANYSRPDFITWVKTPGDINNFKQRDQVQFPAGMYQLMDFAISSITDVNGTNLALMGLADANQAASLEYQRKQAGFTVLAQFFNSLRQYRKRQGRAMLYMIQKWLGDGRLVRITTDSGNQQYVPLLAQADESALEYDVTVDEVASSPNQKEMVWNMMMQAMPFLQQAQLPGEVWADLIKYSPLPDSIAQKIAQSLNVPPDQAAIAFEQTMKQLTLALAKANIDSTNAETVSTMAAARAKMATAEKDIATAESTTQETQAQRIATITQLAQSIMAPPPATQSPFAPGAAPPAAMPMLPPR